MRISISLAVLLFTNTAALASDDVALELGNMFASEEACGLEYDQDAIASFVAAAVDEGDMRFMSRLDLYRNGHAAALKSMSKSQKTAHCTQIKRAALKHKFIAN